jgi:hypothetical protein
MQQSTGHLPKELLLLKEFIVTLETYQPKEGCRALT